MTNKKMIKQVQAYWEAEPCGTSPAIVGQQEPLSREWFEAIEQHRYALEPFIHSWAQFTRWHGKRMLEIGVGAGTDHLQWARAGCECHGVDLTDAGIHVTSRRLACYGFTSNLKRVDAEELPFEDNAFDLVYSWGVIHHTERPEKIIGEIHRVLRPGGTFIGMMYNRRSQLFFKLWVKHALLKARPFRSLSTVVWNHMESVGTKAYTLREIKQLFSQFASIQADHLKTSDVFLQGPRWLSMYFPDHFGFFIGIKARKACAE